MKGQQWVCDSFPRTAFMCVYLLSSLLWNSFTLTSGVTWNEPGKVSLRCPFRNLFERFCVYRSCLWQCIVCMEGSLFPSCSVCLSHCVHTSFILLFLALLSPTLPPAGSPGCASPCPGWWRSSVLPLSYSLPAFFHGHFPHPIIPVRFFPCGESVCPGVFFCSGERVVGFIDHSSCDSNNFSMWDTEGTI